MAAWLDACRFTPTAGGTTDWTFSAAVVGYQSPALAGATNGRVYKFRSESADLSQWELTEGAYNSATGVFARTTVLFNSSGTGTAAGQSGAGSKINFTTVPQVAIVALKEDLISIEEANSFTTTQKAQALSNLYIPPTSQNFASGSGTYTTPSGAKWIEVIAIGGGGGSAGSGTGATNGTTGGTTTFGASLISAGGGTAPPGAGNSAGGAGGSNVVNAPALLAGGGPGNGGGPANTGSTYPYAAAGGGSALGGGGGAGGSANSGGSAGGVNSGGGGGGPSAGPGLTSGASGGGAGSIRAIIPSPAVSYAYSVGAGGNPGGAGTSGNAGSAGGGGWLTVIEHYF